MGFFSDIVRDSQRLPPAVKNGSHGAAPHSGSASKAILPAESLFLGLEAATQPLVNEPYEASRPTRGEQDIRPKIDAPAKAPPSIRPALRHAARHRLHDAESEGLIEIDQVQQRPSTTE